MGLLNNLSGQNGLCCLQLRLRINIAVRDLRLLQQLLLARQRCTMGQ
jgi:hypothetical protein